MTFDGLTPDYSTLSAFQQCHRRFYYEYEQDLTAERVAPVLHAGSALHEGLDALYGSGWDIEAALEAFRQAWSEGDELTPKSCSCDKRCKCRAYLKQGHLEVVLRNYADHYDDRPRELFATGSDLFTEKAFEVDLDGTVVGGIVDRLEKNSQGEICLVDSKTTTGWLNKWWAARKSFAIDHQLRLYWAALEEALDITISKAYIDGIYMGEKADDPPEKWENRASTQFKLFGPFTFSPSQLEETKAFVEQTLRDVEHHRDSERRFDRDEFAWPQNTKNAYGCGNCPFQELCESQPVVRDGLMESKYLKKKPGGKLASGADDDPMSDEKEDKS